MSNEKLGWYCCGIYVKVWINEKEEESKGSV